MGEEASLTEMDGTPLGGYGVLPFGVDGYGGIIFLDGAMLESQSDLPPTEYSGDLNYPTFRVGRGDYNDLIGWITDPDLHGKRLVVGSQTYMIAEIKVGRIFTAFRLREQ
jgi:hypothetical protein